MPVLVNIEEKSLIHFIAIIYLAAQISYNAPLFLSCFEEEQPLPCLKWILYSIKLKKSKNVLSYFGGIFDYELKSERLVEVVRELELPDVWNEPERAQALGKERASLEVVVETIDSLVAGCEDVEGLVELAVEENDEETFADAEQETKALEESIEKLRWNFDYSIAR